MRLLHTADFHVGKQLHHLDRTNEIVETLHEIIEIAKDAKVDAILIAGDLFDTANPSATAQQALFNFFVQLSREKIPVVALAGNHDSAPRLQSLAPVFNMVGVHILATFSQARNVYTLPTSAGNLNIAAIPFISERRLITGEQLINQEDGEQKLEYREIMKSFFENLDNQFKPSEVNIAMAHLTMDGSLLGADQRSRKRQLDITQHFALSPHQLPQNAQYVALGHIHTHQKISDFPTAYYSGSIIQLDFGEVDQKKKVNIIEIFPGQPAKIEEVELKSVRQLKSIRVDAGKIQERLERERGFDGFIKVIVQTTTTHSSLGIKDEVHKILPEAIVHIESAVEAIALPQFVREGKTLIENYEAFLQQKGTILTPELRSAFLEINALVQSEQASNSQGE